MLWGKNVPDRILFALTDLGQPATLEEDFEYLEEQYDLKGTRNVLYQDPGIIRTSVRKWELRSWEIKEYAGLVNSMKETLTAKGTMNIGELAH